MAEKAGYKHFMLKEIFEQPTAARETILGRVSQDTGQGVPRGDEDHRGRSWPPSSGSRFWRAARRGTPALVGKFMIEQLARLPVEVDYGSEYRYRNPIVTPNTLAIVITQSGETADTLAALREAKRDGARSIAICNVVGSMATRETDGTVYTHAGPGDRRRLDQGVHLAARRAVSARRCGSARCAARCRSRPRSRTSTRCCSCRCCSSRR